MVHDYMIHIYLIYMISSRNIAEYKRTYVGNVFSPVANKRLENAASWDLWKIWIFLPSFPISLFQILSKDLDSFGLTELQNLQQSRSQNKFSVVG